ncbi:DsbA family protein [Pseudomonas sp. 21LCFQ010]|uniref:DsbA family protein n=1 Tax=Pseudomonas sp. 21LCFQ010 TaxID=2957506 RepID=UPI00209743DA|nr:DsbA family protein [Pseudomonas sp. 21LCFQ010]MCO8163748.1 DsbA family protein [Pseudomonas sp. 21LCFQ010]
MQAFKLPTQAVVYVMDAYCGWCWGFTERLAEFEAANRHRVAFSAISGGLFIGPRAAAISSYPHIAQANQRISQLTGARFGEGYAALLQQGTAVMDSLDAARALAVLRAHAPERAVYWAHELQAAFYGKGLSLSEPATVGAIAAANGLDVQAVLHDLQSDAASAQARADFAITRQLGIGSYPTLLYIDGNTAHPLPGTGATLAELDSQLDAILRLDA